MNLYEVQNSIEEALCEIIGAAWKPQSILTSEPEQETTLGDLPQATLLCLRAEAAEDELGAFCSEYAQLSWEIYLHAPKPIGGSLAKERRRMAQLLRTELAAATIEDATQVLWEAEVYEAREEQAVSALSDSYVILVRLRTDVEWED